MNLKIDWIIHTTVTGSLLFWISINTAIAEERSPTGSQEDEIALFYSDNSAPSHGIKAVNERLMQVGVRVSQVPIPEESKSILRVSAQRAITPKESDELIKHFQLDRRKLINEIRDAGRVPEMHRGGYLQTSEQGVPPYPKVYDMKAMDDKTTIFLQHKFGKLHVNSSEAGVGIDEVMTIVSGGPYTWFFVLEDNVVGKLRFGKVHESGKAWRISYPGLVPHGGYFDAPHGLVVAYAHGPKYFVMRYEDNSVQGYQTMGDNPWVDFSHQRPVLLTNPKSNEIASTVQ